MDVDSLLAQVGGYKRWNLFVFLLVGMSLNISLCWHGLSIVFVGELNSVDAISLRW